ncbi:MAG: hypothetical protein JST10_06240 [Bacteroidetes bacterium]|nr:hypothetical protein [Bacteroidota bacterium]MBS1632158.1 hypothetical protein [Bacteroidota bacterium]
MKKRVRRALNFFAFNLLFFALYLNFVQKDKTPAPELVNHQNVPAYSKADNSVKYTNVKAESGNIATPQQAVSEKN